MACDNRTRVRTSPRSGVVAMTKTALAATVVVALGIALVSAGQEKQNPPKVPAAGAAEFGGKVLYIELKNPNKANILQKARVQHLGGRAFLVGEYAPRADDEERRFEVYWYPVEDITMLVE